jgi:hypothetical protein
MRMRSTIVPLAMAQALAATEVLAQPNLPPPPPPPMGQPTDLPPLPSPPPPRASPSSSPPSAPAPPPPPPPRRVSPSPAPPPPPSPAPPAYHPSRRRRLEVNFVDEGRSRSIALTLDPLPLILGRLSGSAELLLLPHHSLVASPNLLFFQVDRGGRYNLASEGFGFATQTSLSLGIELGYHYWWQSHDSLRGSFLGPSLLLGTTTQASVGDPSRAQGYWGFAFDVGWQEVLLSGFTFGGGVGLGIARMADATVLFPRVLAQLGWSF